MDAATLAHEVLTWSALDVEPDDAQLRAVVAATVAFVDGLPVVVDNGGAWDDGVLLGATMVAARLYRRRNSPNGLESFGQDGGVTYVSRFDPDVARLLRLSAPAVG